MAFTEDIESLVEENSEGRTAIHDSWLRIKLARVATVVNGFAFKSKNFSQDSGIPLIRIRDILKGKTQTFYNGEIPEGYWVEQGDILVGMDGDFNTCRWDTEKGLLNQRVCKIEISTDIYDDRFLFYCLPEYLKLINEYTSATTVKHLSSKTLTKIPLPLAPINEQIRIANKLDSLLAKVQETQARLEKIPGILKRFRQSVLAAATSGELTREWRSECVVAGVRNEIIDFETKISDKKTKELSQKEFLETDVVVPIPETWSWVRLCRISEVVSGLAKGSTKNKETVSLPYLRVANVQRGFLDLNEVKEIDVPINRVEKLTLKYGDILFNEGGDLDKLGRGWIWEDQVDCCVHQNHVFRARLFNPEFQPKYISYYGNSVGMEYFVRAGSQTVNLANINKTSLSLLPVALPPAQEQKEIVRRVESLFALADNVEKQYQAAKERTDRLTQSLLAKAFRGELVPQDPNDEPASDLLKRIQADHEALDKTKSKKKRTLRKS